LERTKWRLYFEWRIWKIWCC